MWSFSSYKYNCILSHFGEKEKLVLSWHASHWIRKVAPRINLNLVCSLFNKYDLSLYQDWGTGSAQKFWSRCSSLWNWYFLFSASFHNLTQHLFIPWLSWAFRTSGTWLGICYPSCWKLLLSDLCSKLQE